MNKEIRNLKRKITYKKLWIDIALFWINIKLYIIGAVYFLFKKLNSK